jgi:hypothetical protein
MQKAKGKTAGWDNKGGFWDFHFCPLHFAF